MSPPSRYSITMYGAPSWVPTSRTRATCSLWIFTAARASRKKRWTISTLTAIDGSKNLSATRCSRCRCVAAITMPIPPSPRTRSTRYFPATTSPVRTGWLDTMSVTRRNLPSSLLSNAIASENGLAKVIPVLRSAGGGAGRSSNEIDDAEDCGGHPLPAGRHGQCCDESVRGDERREKRQHTPVTFRVRLGRKRTRQGAGCDHPRHPLVQRRRDQRAD